MVFHIMMRVKIVILAPYFLFWLLNYDVYAIMPSPLRIPPQREEFVSGGGKKRKRSRAQFRGW